ncbi:MULTISPECIES: hypothetical protein [unclassified Streptomyces]|uniref:hypothetical protein n=1 Tax=unclassified Streptomyces TaxID=2593676 RepID=UPI00036BF61D|nr:MULTISPECIES: hypothetical protein [unclassified Streptomyces]MYR65171.1 hypothetical protein [Streptomyces sp. SID4939]MYR99781.1 hypothetical protein [Streptomyces sp. SID4940]MYT84617.1 hypothetical protein [Streptomyces sp. SID8360]
MPGAQNGSVRTARRSQPAPGPGDPLHLSRGEAEETGLNAALFALPAVVAWLSGTW